LGKGKDPFPCPMTGAMNYCHMWNGPNTIDTNNRGTVTTSDGAIAR